ncbi:phosphate/phosphite/phosphonate ABC transporter substrate-binding protein, partial [Brevibacterium sp.]|uniref:phosphate/phosphite/phosphonate ABC transporter substrate-binding protein n=1 Tax=Brevibacterium sp. TaxID=1701 RepID=UPI0025B803B5
SSQASAESATCPDGKIEFGIEPFEDPTKLEPAYQKLAEALGESLDCEVAVSGLADYSAAGLAMPAGTRALGQFGPLGYVFASQRADAEALASFGTADGELSTYRGGIWVPKDSEVRGIEDLPGHDLALGSVGSTSGDVLPRSALAESGIAEDQLNINYAGGHPEALLALTNGTVDAAQINTQTLTSAQEAGTFDPSGFRQIWESEDIPNDPITVRGDADPAFKTAVQDALLDLDPAVLEEIGGFLDFSPAGQMLEVTDETYQPLFDLAETMNLTEEDV